MDKPLTNFSILVTRPIEQNQLLCELLTNAGAKAYVFPTIEICAKSSNDLTQQIQELDNYNYVIFTSANAVKHSAELIKQYWPIMPANTQLATIGNSTKIAIEKQGWPTPIYPKNSYSSNALLATKLFKHMTAKNVLILTGEDGLNQLETTLRERNNFVKVAICYTRVIPKYPTSAIMDLAASIIDGIVCTSNATLKNLSLILGTQTIQKFQNTQIFAFNARINDLAKSLGFTKQPIIATIPSDEAIVASIIQYKGRLMTNKNTQATTDQTTQKSIAAKNIEAPKPLTLMSLIAIVISVFALIEGAYVINKTNMRHSSEKKLSIEMTTHLKNQSQQLSYLANQVTQLQTKIQKNASQVRATEQAMQSLKNIKFMNNSRWTLAEIKHLLTMAQYNLKLTPAPATALLILEQVNQQLLQLADPATLPLRQEIVTVMTELKALPTIDYAGTLMQLNAVSMQLNKMPLLINTSNGSAQSLANSTVVSGWRKYWNESLKTLEKLVVIRHQSNSVEPMITPKQQMFVEENIQAKLSQASWALLQHNQPVYTQSLQAALNWIQMYYTPNAPATLMITKTLQSLMKLNFSLQLPDLSTAILLINHLMDDAATHSNTTVKGVN